MDLVKYEGSFLKISGGGEELIGGESRRNSLRLQESQPKSLAIEVVSSQSRVAVSVDGTTVSRLQCSNLTLRVFAAEMTTEQYSIAWRVCRLSQRCS